MKQKEMNFKITDEDLEFLSFQEKMEYLNQFAEFGQILMQGKKNNWSNKKLYVELEPFLNYYKLLRDRVLLIRKANNRKSMK